MMALHGWDRLVSSDGAGGGQAVPAAGWQWPTWVSRSVKMLTVSVLQRHRAQRSGSERVVESFIRPFMPLASARHSLVPY